MTKKIMNDFINELKTVNWFKNSGTPNEKYHMIFSLYKANDGFWGMSYSEVWEPHIYALEDKAAEIIGDDRIDEVFDTISAAIGEAVWNKFGEFITRQHLDNELAVSFELFDNVKRDIAWACVEKILNAPGFFTDLLSIYKEGYFPCSWDGEYPSGKAVVL